MLSALGKVLVVGRCVGGRRAAKRDGVYEGRRRVRAQDVAVAKICSDTPSTRVRDRCPSRDRAVCLPFAFCIYIHSLSSNTLKEALGGQHNKGIVHNRAIIHTNCFFLSDSHILNRRGTSLEFRIE